MALKKYDLLIMRHYLEHYVGAKEIVECISKIIERSGRSTLILKYPIAANLLIRKTLCSYGNNIRSIYRQVYSKLARKQ